MKYKLLKEAHRALRPLPSPPSLTSPNLDSHGTGAKLMSALDIAADTLKIQASQAAGESSIKPALIKSLRDAAGAWATLHGEMRASLQALTNEQYRDVLHALHKATAAEAPPFPLGNSPIGDSEARSNFPPAETSVPLSLPLPTSTPGVRDSGIKNDAEGGRAAPVPLEFDDE